MEYHNLKDSKKAFQSLPYYGQLLFQRAFNDNFEHTHNQETAVVAGWGKVTSNGYKPDAPDMTLPKNLLI